jgi:hypothetical protein
VQALEALEVLQRHKATIQTVFVTNGGSITEEVSLSRSPALLIYSLSVPVSSFVANAFRQKLVSYLPNLGFL